MTEVNTRFCIDPLDRQLIEAINNEGKIALKALPKEYPEFAEVPPSTLWYRVNSLAHEGLIKVQRLRHALICLSVEGPP
jgi:DNA-binding Lrp family transcriptional regulator